jgi:hypothetical protein
MYVVGNMKIIIVALSLMLCFSFSCATTPKDLPNYVDSAAAKSAQGDRAGAIDDYNKAIELITRSSSAVTPMLSDIYINRGVCIRKQ